MLCSAATLQVLNLDTMTAESSAVVHGRITSTHTDWSDSQHKMVLTFYTVQADRYVKGNLGAAFEIVEPGGVIGNRSTVVPGAPEFKVGEELVLFVWTDSVRGRHQAIGFDQGAFRVQRDAATGRKTLNHSQPLIGGGQVVESGKEAQLSGAMRGQHTATELNQFLAQVADSVRRTSQSQQVQQAQGVKQ
jgi:hypothetical protein